MIPRVAALYRYPVKGGTPEICDSLTVLAEGRVAGDRALGFRFADSGLPDTAWSKKHGYAALVNTPAIAQAAGDAGLSEQRFRSNIALEGVAAWAEDRWVGRRVRIGTIEFDVVRTKVRCLATHANPVSGVFDLPVMQTLVRSFRQTQPTMAVALLTRGNGGEIATGDPVTPLD